MFSFQFAQRPSADGSGGSGSGGCLGASGGRTQGIPTRVCNRVEVKTAANRFWKPNGGRSIPGATFSSSLCLCVSALSQHQYCTMSHGSQHRVIPKDLPKDLRQIIIKAEWAVGIRMKAVRMKTEAWAKQKAHTAELAGPMSTLLSYAKCVSDCLCTA